MVGKKDALFLRLHAAGIAEGDAHEHRIVRCEIRFERPIAAMERQVDDVDIEARVFEMRRQDIERIRRDARSHEIGVDEGD